MRDQKKPRLQKKGTHLFQNIQETGCPTSRSVMSMNCQQIRETVTLKFTHSFKASMAVTTSVLSLYISTIFLRTLRVLLTLAGLECHSLFKILVSREVATIKGSGLTRSRSGQSCQTCIIHDVYQHNAACKAVNKRENTNPFWLPGAPILAVLATRLHETR